MKHKLLLLYSWFVWALTFFLPDIPLIMRFRGYLYSLAMPISGNNIQISSSVIIKNLENCYFERDVYLAPHVIINAIDNIYLEEGVMVGFNSVLVSGNHSSINNSFRFGKSIKKPIKVGAGAWVGANCTLIAGSSLPSGSVLAANSVLSKPFLSENSIYAGVPSKKIGTVGN